MRTRKPVIIVSPPEDADLYRDFPLSDEDLVVVSFGEAICSVLFRQADLILIDCGFHSHLGLELLSGLKSRFANIPVVFVTERSSEEVVLRAFKLGARDFFQKPLQIFKVRSTLQNLLEAKRNAREHRGLSDIDENEEPLAGNLCQIGVLRPSVMKVVCYIESNYRANIGLEQMADMANMSRYHFVRVFRRETGMSPVRYLKFTRIQRAKELLKRTELAVFTVALRVGFQDVSNFNKNFKNIEGCTPRQFRSCLT